MIPRPPRSTRTDTLLSNTTLFRSKRSARARRDDEIKQQIKRVHDDSSGLYGTRKVWHQMRREGATVAKCTIERLMRAMGLAGVRRGKTCVTTVSNPKAPCPLDKVNREFRSEEHTSELQSLMRISYAVFCLKK